MSQPTTTALLDELQRRVEQLQELNRVLAAEVDRQRMVVEAATTWANRDKLRKSEAPWASVKLLQAVRDYESSRPK